MPNYKTLLQPYTVGYLLYTYVNKSVCSMRSKFVFTKYTKKYCSICLIIVKSQELSSFDIVVRKYK